MWKNKIAEKRRIDRARKVISAELKSLEKDCRNRMSFDELEKLENLERQGYTHVMAAMDNSGNIVGDVDLIEDKNMTPE